MPELPVSCAGPVSRRSFLEAGSLSLGGLGLSQLLRLQAEASAPPAKVSEPAVILIWLQGGPSHMETYDLKPEAPVEYRGEMRPIHTVVPGMDICELLPLHAQVADKFNLIRSISHGFAAHAGGAGRFLSGRDPLRPLDPKSQHPCLGPMVAKMLEQRDVGVPNYVANSPTVYGGGPAYLGGAYLPFLAAGDPNAEKFEVRNISLLPALATRLEDRNYLLGQLDRLRRDIDNSGNMKDLDQYGQQAMSLLTTSKARDAFDLAREDTETRDRYGRHTWGQRALLARRLVESGVSFVTMQMQNPRVPGSIGNWDIHAVNGHLFNDTRARLPIFDRAVSALIEDIYRRGLDRRVMVVVAGEFGRSPRINPQKGTRSGVIQPGRDHYPAAMSVLVSGGGMPTGQVIGSTTAKGERPLDRKLDPNDLLATVYRHLGIDYHHTFIDPAGRPFPLLPSGEPIAELL
jgi:hypothetical protein